MRKMSEEKRAELKAAAASRRRELMAAAKSKNAIERAELLSELGTVRNVDGRELSEKNLILLAIQAAAAGLSGLSMVGGFRQWQKQGRAVGKGQKGLLICFPMAGAKSEADGGEDGEEGGEEGGGSGGVRFGWSYVWDISQTVEKSKTDDEQSNFDDEDNETMKKSHKNGESAENLNLFNRDLFEHAAATKATATADTTTTDTATASTSDDPAAALLAAFTAA